MNDYIIKNLIEDFYKKLFLYYDKNIKKSRYRTISAVKLKQEEV